VELSEQPHQRQVLATRGDYDEIHSLHPDPQLYHFDMAASRDSDSAVCSIELGDREAAGDEPDFLNHGK
jgi:hypothetical protein